MADFDRNKTFVENWKKKDQAWHHLRQEKEKLLKRKQSLLAELSKLPKIGKNHLEEKRLHIEIRNIEDNIEDLEKQDDSAEFEEIVDFALTSHVNTEKTEIIMEDDMRASDQSDIDFGKKTKKKANSKHDVNAPTYSKTVTLSGIVKKPKIEKPSGTYTGVSSERIILKKLDSVKVIDEQQVELLKSPDFSKRIASLVNAIPSEKRKLNYCPLCEKTEASILKSFDNPSIIRCGTPGCGYFQSVIDTNSPLVYEKEKTQQNQGSSRNSTYFENSLKNILDQNSIQLNEKTIIWNYIYPELKSRGITHVKNVDWKKIYEILYYLKKNAAHDLPFNPSDLYAYCYQIANHIRGEPVIVFGDDLMKLSVEMFQHMDPIWDELKETMVIDKDSSLSMQINFFLIFLFLKLPDTIVSQFAEVLKEENEKIIIEFATRFCKKHNLNFAEVLTKIKKFSAPPPTSQSVFKGFMVKPTHSKSTTPKPPVITQPQKPKPPPVDIGFEDDDF